MKTVIDFLVGIFFIISLCVFSGCGWTIVLPEVKYKFIGVLSILFFVIMVTLLAQRL